MATINLAIVIPDAQMARVQAGMRANWGQVIDAGTGLMRDRTNAELIEMLRLSVISSIKDIVKRTETDAAKAAAASGVTDVTAT